MNQLGTRIRIGLFALCLGFYLWHVTGHLLVSTGLSAQTDISAVIAAHQDKQYTYSIHNTPLDPKHSKIMFKVYTQETFYVVQTRVQIRNIPFTEQHLDLFSLWSPKEQMIKDAIQCIKDSNNKSIIGSIEITYDDKCRLSGIQGSLDVLGISCRIQSHVDHLGLHSQIAAPALNIIQQTDDAQFNSDNVHGIPLLLPPNLKTGQQFDVRPFQQDYQLSLEIGPEEISKDLDLKLKRASVLYDLQSYASMLLDDHGVVYELRTDKHPIVLKLESIQDLSGDYLWPVQSEAVAPDSDSDEP